MNIIFFLMSFIIQVQNQQINHIEQYRSLQH